MTQIGQLTSLTSLTIGVMTLDADAFEDMSVIPNLINIEMMGFKLDSSALRELYRVFPNLRYFKCKPWYSADLTAYTIFDHLRSMHFMSRPKIGTTEVKDDTTGEESLVNVLCTTLSPLESLKFEGWYPVEISSWLLIELKFLRLTDLYLERPRPKQQATSFNILSILVNASMLCKRLTKLAVFYLPSTSVTFTLLVEYFSYLTELRMKCVTSANEILHSDELHRFFNKRVPLRFYHVCRICTWSAQMSYFITIERKE